MASWKSEVEPNLSEKNSTKIYNCTRKIIDLGYYTLMWENESIYYSTVKYLVDYPQVRGTKNLAAVYPL